MTRLCDVYANFMENYLELQKTYVWFVIEWHKCQWNGSENCMTFLRNLENTFSCIVQNLRTMKIVSRIQNFFDDAFN